MSSAVRLDHDTIRIERHFSAAPPLVFAAYADPGIRSRWVAPSAEETIIYSESDFRAGGTDRFLCGLIDSPDFDGTTTYEEIVEERLILCRERVASRGRLLSLSTIAWELEPAGDGTILRITDQVTAIDAPEMLEGSRVGLTTALSNLDSWLGGTEGDRR